MIRRLHPYEVLLAVHFVALLAMAPGVALRYLPQSIYIVAPGVIGVVIVAIIIRIAIAAARGQLAGYLAVIRDRNWIMDAIRLIWANVLMTHIYGWVKLLVPIEHPRLQDQTLWSISKSVFGGYSPEVFLLTLFSNPHFLDFIDRSYAGIFFGSMLGVTGYFLSSPDSTLRTAFMTSQTMLWLTGGWLYMLVPSLGPAYAFPSLWMQYSADLHTTQALQAVLMRNYHNVIRLSQGTPADVNMVYGIAAFPSLHVGFQSLVSFWMRRQWPWGQLLFGLAAFFVFIGSMITGWHYFIDGVAGVALAYLSYRAGAWVLTRKTS